MKAHFLKLLLIGFLGLLLFSCSDLDDNEEIGTVAIENLIEKESELFGLIERVAETDSINEITCIKFRYSFTMLEFDSDLMVVNQHVVSSDPQFSTILENVPEGHSIGINFPIQSILESGEEFLIQNKDELKEAIDNCVMVQQDEIAGNCRVLLQECVWVISHEEEGVDTYENAVFDVAVDGTFKFYNNGELHEGTWIVYFIEYELHTNVTFDEPGMTADDWNFDWKTEVLPDNIMTFTAGDVTFTLTQECEEENYCTELAFSECEGIVGSEISEFIFEDYITCILQIEDLEELGTNDTIAFYETEEDATIEVNALLQTSYQNTSPEQTIYVRVYTAESDEFFIIPITIISTTC